MKRSSHQLKISPERFDSIKRGVTKVSRGIAAAGVAALICFAHAGVANAAEIKLLAALGVKEVVDDLGPKFERASGHKLAIKFGTLGGVVKMVQGGETADVVIIPRQGIDGIVKDGKAAAGGVTDIARSEIVVVVRKGAPKPDISSPEALKRALLAAKSITYGNPADGGASAIHFAKVLDRLGIANEMKSKTIYAKAGGDTGVVVASGKAELGVNQLQVLMPVAGIEVAGPLPGDLQATTVFSSAIMTGAKNAAPAKALVNFLRTPEAAKVIRAKGMNLA
jgi:molybdate transport system substrate-binding protein